MNNYVNPDYPATTGAWGFNDPVNTNTNYYWNGGFQTQIGGYTPMMASGDSRRNQPVMNPVNPNPFQQFGQVTTATVPENQVQPLSSYPPASPAEAARQQMSSGLNPMLNVNTPTPSALPQNNPWATQPQQSTTPINPWAPGTVSTPTPNFFNPGIMDYHAINMASVPSIDKKTAWSDVNAPQFYPTPQGNWNTNPQLPSFQQTQQNYAQNTFGNPTAQPQYALPQFPTQNMSWKDEAEKNWSMSNL